MRTSHQWPPGCHSRGPCRGLRPWELGGGGGDTEATGLSWWGLEEASPAPAGHRHRTWWHSAHRLIHSQLSTAWPALRAHSLVSSPGVRCTWRQPLGSAGILGGGCFWGSASPPALSSPGLQEGPHMATWNTCPPPCLGPDPCWPQLLASSWRTQLSLRPWVFSDPPQVPCGSSLPSSEPPLAAAHPHSNWCVCGLGTQ